MDENKSPIPLDGTWGVGTMAEVKVFTRVKNSDQLREESFMIPYMFLDLGMLAGMHKMNLFAGFSLITEGKPNGLKELGL